MQSLPFTIEQDSPDEPAVGLIVLQSDETMEHELRQWLPDNIRLFHTRIPNDLTVSSTTLQRMKEALPAATGLLPEATRFKVIVYGCTSGATVIGEQAVTEIVQSLFPDARVTNPLSALKAQLTSLNARHIALLTPYVPEVSAALMDVLEQSGIQIIQVATFNESQDNRVARISRSSLLDAIQELGKTEGIDAIVASCTNLRTHSLLNEASQATGVPVLSSNSAVAWHIEALLQSENPA